MFSQLFSVKAMLCTVQGIYSCAKGSIDWRERKGELRCCSCCGMEWCLSLLTDFSRTCHGQHPFLKTKACTFLFNHPLLVEWETDRTPGFLLLTSLLSSLPSWADRSDTGICSSPSQGLHRKNMVDVLDILVQAPENYGKSHQHVKPKINLVQILPSSPTVGWMKEMLKITAWCQLLSRLPPLACWGLWSVAPLIPQPWTLKDCACCQ